MVGPRDRIVLSLILVFSTNVYLIIKFGVKTPENSFTGFRSILQIVLSGERT